MAQGVGGGGEKGVLGGAGGVEHNIIIFFIHLQSCYPSIQTNGLEGKKVDTADSPTPAPPTSQEDPPTRHFAL